MRRAAAPAQAPRHHARARRRRAGRCLHVDPGRTHRQGRALAGEVHPAGPCRHRGRIRPGVRRPQALDQTGAFAGPLLVAGGTLAGALYARSVPLLGWIIAAMEAVAMGLYITTLRTHSR